MKLELPVLLPRFPPRFPALSLRQVRMMQVHSFPSLNLSPSAADLNLSRRHRVVSSAAFSSRRGDGRLRKWTLGRQASWTVRAATRRCSRSSPGAPRGYSCPSSSATSPVAVGHPEELHHYSQEKNFVLSRFAALCTSICTFEPCARSLQSIN